MKRVIFHEKSCDRLCLLDFNEWNCIIFLYGTIKLIIIIIIIIVIIIIIIIIMKLDIYQPRSLCHYQYCSYYYQYHCPHHEGLL